eukprot:SAG31_NODE_10184_length_1174_cov_0.710698_1_plen_295_part_10
MKLSRLKLVNTLERVVLISQEQEACSFLTIKHAVQKFVRLSKRLQEESACIECVAAVDELRTLCCSYENRMLMAQLDCASSMSQVFMLDVPTKRFAEMKHHLFRLVTDFVDDCPPNQEALSSSVRSVFVPLLYSVEYFEEVSVCIAEIVDNHQKLAKEFASVLVQTVVDLFGRSGFKRHACLLEMLRRLLQCHGTYIPECQLTVCKGVTMAGHPIVDLTGCDVDSSAEASRLSETQSLAFLYRKRQELLIRAFRNREQSACDDVEYYLSSLNLLQKCVVGFITANERCAVHAYRV